MHRHGGGVTYASMLAQPPIRRDYGAPQFLNSNGQCATLPARQLNPRARPFVGNTNNPDCWSPLIASTTGQQQNWGIASNPSLLNVSPLMNSADSQVTHSRRWFNPREQSCTSNEIYSNDTYEGFPPLIRID